MIKRLAPLALVAALAVTGVAAGPYRGEAGATQGPASVAASAPAAAPAPPEVTPPPDVTPAPEVGVEPPVSPAPDSTDQAGVEAWPVEPTQPAPVEPAVDPRTPERLRMWKFDAPVIPVDLDGDVLTPPDDPTVLGWWGQPAGAAQGTTLLVGHTVSTGGGTFDDLEHTPVGEIARVSGVKYRVERVNVISQEQLARRAERLFDQAGPHRLVLVTCEGWDPVTRTYSENVVVVATPVR